MNKIEKIGDTNLAWRRINYRKKDRVQHQQELNNARYEGAMRSDFRQPKVDEYTYDKLEIVRLKAEA
jgi:hypothetical protein